MRVWVNFFTWGSGWWKGKRNVFPEKENADGDVQDLRLSR
jgi:hypothetical protein